METNNINQFKNGLKNGEWHIYKNDKLFIKENYIDGKLNGKYEKYHIFETNKLAIECNYIDDKLEGEYTIYLYIYESDSNEPKIIKEIYNYKNGLKNGEYIKFNSDSKIKIICNYMNGLKNGECKEYYSSGKLWKKYNYIDDKLDGEYIEYSYNSSPIYKYYTNGIMQEGYIAHISNFIKNKLIEFL